MKDLQDALRDLDKRERDHNYDHIEKTAYLSGQMQTLLKKVSDLEAQLHQLQKPDDSKPPR